MNLSRIVNGKMDFYKTVEVRNEQIMVTPVVAN